MVELSASEVVVDDSHENEHGILQGLDTLT